MNAQARWLGEFFPLKLFVLLICSNLAILLLPDIAMAGSKEDRARELQQRAYQLRQQAGQISSQRQALERQLQQRKSSPFFTTDPSIAILTSQINALRNQENDLYGEASRLDGEAGRLYNKAERDRIDRDQDAERARQIVDGMSKSCFIATAAYGTPMEEEVVTLRQFRDEYLLASRIGQWFVAQYYDYSPPVASIISEHESLRMLTRAALTPIVYGVKAPREAAVCFMLFVLSVALLRRQWKRFRHSLRLGRTS